MSDRLYFGTYIEFYIPINDDGTAGIPIVTKKFTNPIQNKGSGSTSNLKRKQPPKKLTSSSAGEVIF